jgi:hypothetical protein
MCPKGGRSGDKLLRKLMKRLVKKDLDKYFDFDIPPTPARDFTTKIMKEKVEIAG